MTIRESVIVSAVRTPTGKFLGALKNLPATELGALVVREAVARAGIEPVTSLFTPSAGGLRIGGFNSDGEVCGFCAKPSGGMLLARLPPAAGGEVM